ncbi:MAG: 30S ribosomal protein S3 [Candidatus Altiarchaeota archaeon]|nr:30S ribosomal protein S3 [Candidatus Altiarchaeota archaeon]
MEKHFIQEGVIRSEIESFLKNDLSRTGFSSVNIQKTPTATRIILYIEKPPLVIGKKGKRINRLTTILTEKYGLDNPTIDVQRVERPTLDPNIVARRIAVALERGINRRRIAYKALRAIMLSGARGAEIVLSGKIVGKGGRSRVEKYSEGYMKKAGDSLRLVDMGSTQATLKAGVIGVTVKIVQPGTVFPDQISVLEKKPAEKAAAAIEKPAEKIDQKKKSKKKKEDTSEKKEKKAKAAIQEPAAVTKPETAPVETSAPET